MSTGIATGVQGGLTGATGPQGPSRSYVASDANTLIEWTMVETALSFVNHGQGAALVLGTVSGSPIPVNVIGLVGGAVACLGAACMTTGATSTNEPAGASFTVSFWIKPLNLGTGQILFNKTYHSASWASPYTSLYVTTGNSTALGIIGAIAVGGTLFSTPQTGTGYTMIANDWNHVAFTYDGANMRVYVNGELGDTTAQTGSVDFGTHGSWDVGGSAAAAGGYAPATFSDVRVENTVRSATYIRAMYATGMLQGP